MKNILVIIPLHEYNKKVEELLLKAINSVPDNIDVTISTTKDIADKFKNELNSIAKKYSKSKSITTIFNNDDNKSDFCTLVNNVVNVVDYEWFTILEYDDEYTPNWFDNVYKELEYKTDVSVFLPLTELVDFNKNTFVSYGNEAPWASSFSNEIGYIDNESLQQFFDFYLTGSVFNLKDWVNFGGLKPSIKLTFWYEFMLRLTSNNKKLYVIPKLGYRHYVNRDGSLYEEYKKTISVDESKWWYDLAKQECTFKEDRNIIYTDTNNEKGE